MFSSILVTLDGTRLAETVLPFVTEIAAKFGSTVHLLEIIDPSAEVHPHAYEMPPSGGPLAPYPPPADEEEVEEADEQLSADHEAAQAYLARIVAELERRGIQARTAVVEGDPVEEILSYAAAERVALIAMSTHGRRGLARLLSGSVAERVIRQAPCPVLAYRPDSQEE